MDWIVPLPSEQFTRPIRHIDVSQDPRYTYQGLSAFDGDVECTEAPTRISPWVLPTEETQALFAEGHGTAPKLIYGRGVPAIHNPYHINANKKLCSLIMVEVGF
jgi:hypothetical protein